MVVALEGNEAGARNQRRQFAALLEWHTHVASAVDDQGGHAQFRSRFRNVDVLHVPENPCGDLSRGSLALKVTPPAVLFWCSAGNEKIGEELAERRIVPPPANTNEIDQGLGFKEFRFALGARSRALAIGVH